MGHERAVHLFLRPGIVLPVAHHASNISSVLEENKIKERGSQRTDNIIVSQAPHHTEMKRLPSITFEDVTEGTKGFDANLKIGEGQFFELYKAHIRNKTYIVKLFQQENSSESKKQMKIFLSELEVFLLFQHSNILELVGYFSQNSRMCLIHPHMKNGSLLDRIQCTGNSAPLSWEIRLNILVGTARAIQYLHAAQPCSILCGSLTSANILLDGDFEAKLSDFGTAHLRSHLISKSYTINMQSGAMKLLGYLPEEYIRHGKLSTKTDIYSYGIVVMEAMTGCKAGVQESKHIFLRDLLLEHMESGGAESCFTLLDQKAGGCSHSAAHMLFTLALHCAASRGKARPTIEEVLENLGRAQHLFHFTEDLPKSLKSLPPATPHEVPRCHSPPTPVENDESEDFFSGPPRGLTTGYPTGLRPPLECSQSEVTFLSSTMESTRVSVSAREHSPAWRRKVPNMPQKALLRGPGDSQMHMDPSDDTLSPYPSWLVECSCSAGVGGSDCEDCIANGFGRDTGSK